jgi:hypothetical protein
MNFKILSNDSVVYLPTFKDKIHFTKHNKSQVLLSIVPPPLLLGISIKIF